MGTGVCPDASGTEGKLRHRAPHRKDHTSPSHSSWDLGETPRWPQTHIMLSPHGQAGPPGWWQFPGSRAGAAEGAGAQGAAAASAGRG